MIMNNQTLLQILCNKLTPVDKIISELEKLHFASQEVIG